MKLRSILTNDRPETIEQYKQLVLDANPDCTIEGIDINPIQKNDAREGTFEVDIILKHQDEKLMDKQIKAALAQADEIIKQQDLSLTQLINDKKALENEIKTLKKNG